MRLPTILHAEGLGAGHGGAPGDCDAVLEEQAGEPAVLGHVRHVGQEPEAKVGFTDGVGMAPSGRMATGNAE
jgi:hypothetical protein